MKIAFIGQKGIPATWGGVEYYVDELSRRLVKRGHQVSVYVRYWYTHKRKDYEGVRLIHTPTLKTKHLDAALHSLSSSLHAALMNYDLVHYQGMGPALFSWLPETAGKKVIATIHRFVAQYQKKFYENKGYKVTCITNAVDPQEPLPPNLISQKYGLTGQDYILSMGRLTPEKRVDWLIRAHKEINPGGIKWVIAGGSSATRTFVEKLHYLARGNPDVIFTGYVAGKEKQELLSNARLFVIPSSVEGLPIALLEAMSYGLGCLASAIPAHSEIITEGQDGFLFDHQDFSSFVGRMQAILSNPGALKDAGLRARAKVEKEYTWDQVVRKTEQVYEEVLGLPR
ncbi:MAG: hypothetical protein AMS15_09615 [Planctomycetes bacterium DG_23]|nr:MAG: hypothetical protein AMS15_09615 [Planctomycetes bacterium DG_23]